MKKIETIKELSQTNPLPKNLSELTAIAIMAIDRNTRAINKIINWVNEYEKH